MPFEPRKSADHIKQAALELGFDRCGIASPGPITRGPFIADWLARGHAGSMQYLHRHPGSRVDVRDWLPWARSVIVVALNYRADPPRVPIQGRGKVAMYAWGEDYHVVVRRMLEKLVETLQADLKQPFKSRVCVDTSAITERELAAAAGIGWIGKNTMVMHQSIGSFFFLGEVVTDLELPFDEPEPDHCGSCTRCLDACPTAAFPEPYVMDASRCISYLTIEHRDEIDPDLANQVGDWIYGCDDCQTVCPFNERQEGSRPAPAPDDAMPKLDDVLAWDHDRYRAVVRGKATDRAKQHMWKRNAEIVKQNQVRRQ